MRTETFNVDDLIEELKNTCISLPEGLPNGMQEEDLTPDDLAEIDSEIFQCETCGWWCEQSENTGEEICEDCKEEES